MPYDNWENPPLKTVQTYNLSVNKEDSIDEK